MPRTPDRDFTMAELKATLAMRGETVHPEARLTHLEKPKAGESANLVLLERVTAGITPAYCTHGYASCINCESLCWIGHATEKVLINREAFAICLDCAHDVVPAGTLPIGHIHDHRREDGPHD